MIRLELLSEAHLAGMAEMIRDPDVLRFTRIPVPTPPDFPQTWLAAYEQHRLAGTREAFAIVEDGEFLGVALAPEIRPEAREAELGYVVMPAARGRGVATESVRLLTDWAFGELGMLRLTLMISPENEPSKGVARRCGYTYEGTLRSIHVKEGVREDTELWSRLPGDP